MIVPIWTRNTTARYKAALVGKQAFLAQICDPLKYSLGFDGASANSRVDLPAGMVDDYPISVSYWFKTGDVTRIGIHFNIHIASGKWCIGGHWSDGVYYTGVRSSGPSASFIY